MIAGCMDGISVIIRSTILQLKTPDELRGRVMSVNSMFINSSNELGQFESGLAARLLGTVRSVVFGGWNSSFGGFWRLYDTGCCTFYLVQGTLIKKNGILICTFIL